MRDFKCFLWHRFGAGLFALRRREFVRHAATGRPCVALARASLWLLLAGVLGPEAVMLMVFFCVWSVGKVCADLFLGNYITDVFRGAAVRFSGGFCGRNSGSSDSVALF